jgi:transcriptional regulator with XRE-family HTH domain
MASASRQITLHEARILNGLSLDDAANRLGISPSELGQYEIDPASIYVSMAVKIARLYNIDIDYLDFSSMPLHSVV